MLGETKQHTSISSSSQNQTKLSLPKPDLLTTSKLSSLASEFKSHIDLIQQELAFEKAKIENQHKQLKKEIEIMSQRYFIGDEILELNVGGKTFTTYRSTLTKVKNSMLEAMFSGRHKVDRDSKNRIFLDRCPRSFEIILNYLRTGELVWPTDSQKRRQLELELEYYGLTEHVDKSIVVFTWESNFDENGLLYWIATQGKTKSYVNPVLSGAVKIIAAEGYYNITGGSCDGRRDLSDVVARNALSRVCCSAPNAKYFILDIGPKRRFNVTKYTLACNFNPEKYLSNWKLLGSNDLQNWKQLTAHVDDRHVKVNSPWSWDVPQSDCSYRYFKIEGSTQVLLSGWEMYGTLTLLK